MRSVFSARMRWENASATVFESNECRHCRNVGRCNISEFILNILHQYSARRYAVTLLQIYGFKVPSFSVMTVNKLFGFNANFDPWENAKIGMRAQALYRGKNI